MAWVCLVSTRKPSGEIARAVRADVARHDVVVLHGRPSQARQLRRVMAELRASGFRARYFTDGVALHQLVVTAPGQEMPRVLGWWGG